MLLEKPGESLDGGESFFLRADSQGPAFGCEAEGDFLLILFQDIKGKLLDAGYSILMQECGEVPEDSFCVQHTMSRETASLHMFKVFRYQPGHVHLGGSPYGLF